MIHKQTKWMKLFSLCILSLIQVFSTPTYGMQCSSTIRALQRTHQSRLVHQRTYDVTKTDQPGVLYNFPEKSTVIFDDYENPLHPNTFDDCNKLKEYFQKDGQKISIVAEEHPPYKFTLDDYPNFDTRMIKTCDESPSGIYSNREVHKRYSFFLKVLNDETVKSRLKHLSLRDFIFDDVSTPVFLNFLKDNNCIEYLDLRSNKMTQETLATVFESLQGNQSLKVIDISNNNVHTSALLALSDFLTKNMSLEVLKMGTTSCKYDPRGDHKYYVTLNVEKYSLHYNSSDSPCDPYGEGVVELYNTFCTNPELNKRVQVTFPIHQQMKQKMIKAAGTGFNWGLALTWGCGEYSYSAEYEDAGLYPCYSRASGNIYAYLPMGNPLMRKAIKIKRFFWSNQPVKKSYE